MVVCIGLSMATISLAQTRLYIETDCLCHYKAYARFSNDPGTQWIRPLESGYPVDINLLVNATLLELIIEEASYGQVFIAHAPIPVSPNILQVDLTHDCRVDNPPPIPDDVFTGDCQLGDDGVGTYWMKVTCKRH